MSELEEECGFNDCGGTCLGNSLCDVCLGKVGKLNARVKELESHIDAYAESNAKLMEEKLKDSAYIAELEAWQKEAVPFLRLFLGVMLPLSKEKGVFCKEEFKTIANLIKQAEAK